MAFAEVFVIWVDGERKNRRAYFSRIQRIVLARRKQQL